MCLLPASPLFPGPGLRNLWHQDALAVRGQVLPVQLEAPVPQLRRLLAPRGSRCVPAVQVQQGGRRLLRARGTQHSLEPQKGHSHALGRGRAGWAELWVRAPWPHQRHLFPAFSVQRSSTLKEHERPVSPDLPGRLCGPGSISGVPGKALQEETLVSVCSPMCPLAQASNKMSQQWLCSFVVQFVLEFSGYRDVSSSSAEL